MKVAFWNGISKTDSIANYVAAIGMTLAVECNCNVILGSNYISNRMPQDCFSGKMLEEGIAHMPYCFLYGSPEYYGKLWRMKRFRQGNILQMPIKRMTIVYPPDVAEYSMFYYKMPRNGFYLLDMARCSIAESRNVLDEAELVVVFLMQDEIEIQNFFERFSSLIPKAIFIIVDYQRNSVYSFQRLKEKYGINRENMEFIPKNKNFYAACEEGNISHFMSSAARDIEEGYDGNFLVSIRRIAKKIHIRGVCLCTKEGNDE